MNDRVPFWRQRLPFSGLLASAIAGILLAAWLEVATPAFAAAFLLSLVVWIFHRREAWIFLAGAFAFAAIHTWQTRESPAHMLAEALGEENHIATVRGRVIGHSTTRDGVKSRFLLEVGEIDWNGRKILPACRVLVLAPVEAPQWNDRVEAIGTLRRIQTPRNPGQFDARPYLAIQGITCELLVTAKSDIAIEPAAGFSIPRLASVSRRWMEATLREGISSDTLVCNLLAGLVLGATTEIPESLQDKFRQTGTYHIFSVSGLHVGMIAYILWHLLRAFAVNPRLCVAIIIPAVFFYSLVTGWKPSSVRAATMTAIFLLGMISSRQPVPLNSLCAAAFLILAQSTNQLFNPGFQLSVIVVAAIVVFSAPLQTLIKTRLDPDPFIPPALWTWFQKTRHTVGLWVAGLVAVSIAAWIGSLPLMLVYFQLVSLSALIANPFVVPLAFVIMATALASLACGLAATVLAAALNNANLVLVKILVLLIESLAVLPGAYFTFGRPAASPVSVTVFDFGRGGGAALRTGGTLWLLDCGSAWDFENTLRPWMRLAGKPWPDGLILSHGDSRHIGGAAMLLEGWKSPRIVDSRIKDRSTARRRLHAELEARGIPKSLHLAGDTIELPRAARLRILHPPKSLEAAKSNDKSIIPLLETVHANILFLSDSGPSVWEALPPLRADILVLGRHHSGLLPESEFLETSGVRAIVATASDYPAGESIDPFWAAMLDELGIELFRMDHTGAVQIDLGPRSTKISAFLNGQSLQIPR
jgi:competence protein ComEC